MGIEVALANFSKGELSPSLYGRIDTNQYNAGLKKARNWLVMRYGGVTFRPGTRLVGKVDDPDVPLRLVPFQFSIDQAYAVIFQQAKMRPLALGGFVLEENLKVISATKANPCVLEVAYHDYTAGERIYLRGIEGMTELNERFATVVAVIDASHFSIDLDSTGFGTLTDSDGETRVATPPPPPPPPPVPPPVDPPDPPDVGGGGGRGNNQGNIP